MLNINELLKTAMKNKDSVELAVIRSIKAEFAKYETAKSGNVITEAVEISILNKMKNQRMDSILAYEKAGRTDLVECETSELNALLKFVPSEASEDEIKCAVNEAIIKLYSDKPEGYVLSMRDMKFISSEVKNELPTADGKKIAELFKCKL